MRVPLVEMLLRVTYLIERNASLSKYAGSRRRLVPLLAHLVCGSPARNHDFDFARRRLLDELYAAGDIRTDVFQDYDRCGTADLLVSYTSQVPVGDEECAALRRFLERGGRWFAIHASNSVRDNPHLPGILGSRFITHPPYLHFNVQVMQPHDP